MILNFLKSMKESYWNKFYKSFGTTLSRSINFPRTKPKNVLLATTNLCNSRCKTCNIWKLYRKNPNMIKTEFKFDEFKLFVDNLISFSPSCTIQLTGGEPFIRKDIEKIASYIIEKTKTNSFTIPTNALPTTRIKRIMINLKKKYPEKNIGFNVSIEGFEKQHNYIRGVNSYKKALNLVKWGLENGFYMNVSTTLSDYNIDDFPDFVDYLISLGLPPNHIIFRVANTAETYYSIDTKRLVRRKKDMIKTIEEVKRRHKEFDSFFINGMIEYIKNPSKFQMPCFAMFSYCFIDPYFNVFPCCVWSLKVGNLRETNFDLEPIWYSKKAEQARSMIKKENCPNCWIECTAGLNISFHTKTAIKAFIKRFFL